MNISDDELVGIYLACKRELIKRARANCDLAIVNAFSPTYYYDLGLLEIMIGKFIYECEDGVEIDGVTYTIGG